MDWLNKQIKGLERNINDHIDQHPDLKLDAELLSSIPGIGDTTAAIRLIKQVIVDRLALGSAQTITS